tara:strand:- start:22 stop:285 length:264 start_codon:yes stop_codon:yes gene_type:complete
MNQSNKTWKQAFAEVNAMHLKGLKRQEELLIEKVIQKYGKFGITPIEFDYDHTWITDPSLDETGRFEVVPVEYYGETYLKALENLIK